MRPCDTIVAANEFHIERLGRVFSLGSAAIIVGAAATMTTMPEKPTPTASTKADHDDDQA